MISGNSVTSLFFKLFIIYLFLYVFIHLFSSRNSDRENESFFITLTLEDGFVM